MPFDLFSDGVPRHGKGLKSPVLSEVQGRSGLCSVQTKKPSRENGGNLGLRSSYIELQYSTGHVVRKRAI